MTQSEANNVYNSILGVIQMERNDAISFYKSICKCADDHINFDWTEESEEKDTFLGVTDKASIMEDEHVYFIKNVTADDLKNADKLTEE